jgi:hypothetical protein
MAIFNFRAYFFLGAMMIAGFLYGQDTQWTYKGEKDGVKVYLKIQEGVYDVKLTTSIQTSLSAICHLMGDVEAYSKWGYKVAESSLIEQKNEYHQFYYSRLDFPWPLNDRDLTMENFMEQDRNGKVTFKSYSRSGLKPERKEIIRLDDVATTWVIFPPKNGWAYVEYYIHSNPKGNLPEWLVNLSIDMGPRETINAIRKELKKTEYQTLRLAHIRD